MANDWLKIKVDGTSEWGTTGTGPSGTTGITISADTCDAAIARCATIVFRAGSLTKRLKVTQGVSASPKIQLVAGRLDIACGQTVTVTLRVSNYEELDSYFWKVTPEGDTSKVTIKCNGVTKTGPFSENNTSTAEITITNNDTSGSVSLNAELCDSQSPTSPLSRDTKRFILTGSQTQTPTIILSPQTLELKETKSGNINLQVSNVSTVPSYRWYVSIYGFNGTNVDPRYNNAFVVSPESGNTQSSTIQIVNNSVTSGTVTIRATLTGDFPGSPVFSNEVVVTCLPNTNYSIQVFQQPAASVTYRDTVSVGFRLKNGDETVTDSNIGWTLTTTEEWMSHLVTYSPSSSGNFGNQPDKTVTITNESRLYSTTAVTFVVNAWSNGSKIAQSANMTVTLVPNIIIQILNPEPSQGGSVTLEIGAAGGTFSDGAFEFRSNVDWTAYTDNSSIVTSMSPNSGNACADNQSYTPTITIAPNQTGEELTAHIYIQPQGSGMEIYRKTVFVTVLAEETYITVDIPQAGYFLLSRYILSDQYIRPIHSNIKKSFNVLYSTDDVTYTTTKPSAMSWLGALVRSTDSSENPYALTLSTLEDNYDGVDDGTPLTRPSGATSTYYIKLENGGVTSNVIPVKQDKMKLFADWRIYYQREKNAATQQYEWVNEIWADVEDFQTTYYRVSTDGVGGDDTALRFEYCTGVTGPEDEKIYNPSAAVAPTIYVSMGRHNNGFAQARSQDDQSWYDIKDYPHTATQQLPIAVHAKQYHGADGTTGTTTVNVYSDSTCQTIIWQGVFWQEGTEPSIVSSGSTTVSWEGVYQSPTTSQITTYFDAEIIIGTQYKATNTLPGTTRLVVEFFAEDGEDPNKRPIDYIDTTQAQTDLQPLTTASITIADEDYTSYNLEPGAQYTLHAGPWTIPARTKWIRVSYSPNPYWDGVTTHAGLKGFVAEIDAGSVSSEDYYLE